MSDQANPSRVCDLSARVVSNVNSCREHFTLELEIAHFPQSKPGQFVQILCADDADHRGNAHDRDERERVRLDSREWRDESAFLRRPFSIADRQDDDRGPARILIIHRAIGKGTRWLERLDTGDTVNVTGPLGRGFTMPDPNQRIILIGGGVGIPPLLYLARVLHERGHTKLLAVFGARSRDLFHIERLFEPPRTADPAACLRFPHGRDVPALVTTDDGSLGIHGRVTDALAAWHRGSAEASDNVFVVACGPEPMLQSVARLTRELNMACELCIERMMACGLGTCLACVARVRDPNSAAGWRYALTCMEGPVFERDSVLDFAEPQA